MKRTTVKRAADAYRGTVTHPPKSRAAASAIFGTEIPKEAWLAIASAFSRHGHNLNALTASRFNKNKNDPLSWHSRHADTRRRLDQIYQALEGINLPFLIEAAENIELARMDGKAVRNPHQVLNEVFDGVDFLMGVVNQTEPQIFELPSEAQSRKDLTKAIYEILKPYGAEIWLGWELSDLPKKKITSEEDLTKFEKLIVALDIHKGKTPYATSRWIRNAVSGTK